MNLHDAVYKRISTRTYEQKQLTYDDIVIIKSILVNYSKKNGPFAHSFDFALTINDSQDTNGTKIGTYGLLKNVPAFIGGVCENSLESIIDFGYVFEHILLELTAQEFGTCWLGGTFKRKDYRKALKDNQIIPAISPVGYRASKRSIMDRMLRSTAQSDNRLPYSDLFLDGNLNPLHPEFDKNIMDCLNMVRKGPSASNKQPWRMIVDVDQKAYHLYIARTPHYAKPLKYDIQALDIGIALAHFEQGLHHYNITFTREKLEQYPQKEGWEYILSLSQID